MHPVVSRALALFLVALPLAPALAQTAGQPAGSGVNVYQYALDNPVENSTLKRAPSLGASVPSSVKLVPLADEKFYSYFYYDGQPVIVEQATRSVVRIGG